MPDVTLYVDSNTPGCKYVSDVRIYSQETDSFNSAARDHETGESTRYDLGALDPLSRCYLLVNTVVRKENQSIDEAEITYRVDYEDHHIEKRFTKAKFDEAGFAFFRFEFRFCPRFPFC